jgi:glycosyltransferase involved in cell wall biosynthesis
MIIPSLSFGGAENIAVGLAEESVKNNHTVSFISLYKGNDYKARLEKLNINVNCLNYDKGFGFSNIYNVYQLRKLLIKTIVSVGPDIIHTHLFLVKMVLYNIKLSFPILDTQHDISPWWSNKSINAILKTIIEKRYAKKTANKIVAITYSVEKNIIHHLNVNSQKIVTIFNFIERNTQLNNDVQFDGIFTFTIISRIQIKKKGLDLFAQIISILVEKYKVENFKVVVVGDGPDLLFFKKMINEKSLDKYFYFKGYQKDIYNYYNQSNLVVIPSRWEGFGLTAAEAAISGKAVLAFNIPGLNEVVLNNETGILVKPYNVDQFAQNMARLMNDKDELNQLGKKAQVMAKSRFMKNIAFEYYENEYNKLTTN